MKNDILGMGWTPDIPDMRDYTIDSPEIVSILSNATIKFNPVAPAKGTKRGGEPTALAATVDLRDWCSPIENQGRIGSCTANAGVGILEYYQRRAFGMHLDASRLFLYKVTRNLLQWTGDTGAYIRTTMKAMAGFGVCPEQYWPYSDTKTGSSGSSSDPFEKEPSSFCYSFANNYKSVKYYRLDPAGASRSTILTNVKAFVAAGLPAMFGFTVYDSISQASSTGKIPYPVAGNRVSGGHAVVIVGYDDNLKIKNGSNGPTTTGAFIIRNSWGTGWGDNGYGYLPYEYVLKGLAQDFWSIIQADFFDTNQF